MARPKKNLPPARTHRITVRLTDEMFDVVTRDAKAANLSNAEYIRYKVSSIFVQKILYKNVQLLCCLNIVFYPI